MENKLERPLSLSAPLSLYKNLSLTTLVCSICLLGGQANAAATKCSGIAFVHGSDRANDAGLGISAWLSKPDGSFGQLKYSMGGFERNNFATEVFGDGRYESTRFVDVNNDGAADIVHIAEDNQNSINVYLNNKDNTFNTKPIITNGMSKTSWQNGFTGTTSTQQTYMCDTNKDGNIDYIFGDNQKGMHVYLGKGDGKFDTTPLTSKMTAVDSYYGRVQPVVRSPRQKQGSNLDM